MRAERRASAAALCALAVSACGPPAEPTATFAEHVAPILFEHCVPCHRPAGAAPFALVTYDDARERARQIERVTAMGFMPPWLPATGLVAFLDERRLDAAELATLSAWVAQGTPEGDPARLPRAPAWKDEWQLGTPDRILEMDSPYSLAADGRDVYRNFVLPAKVAGTRYVRAVEFDPGNPRVVHHARVLLDRTPVSRYRDRESPEPGFSGMDSGSAQSPEGHLLGWTPGKRPRPGRDGLAWRLEPGDDVVLQLHMVPTGRPESVRARIGLHFAGGPPRLRPYALVLGSRRIDLPAGAADVHVEDSYRLPVDVACLAVYPHAHYLAREMKVWAELPDGSKRWLLHVPDWDFNWQDEYHYREPLALPRGATIRFDFAYDNSASNVRNPSFPPRRVVYGPASTDEMAEVLIQLLPRDEADLETLAVDAERRKVAAAIEYRQELLAADPRDAASHSALASSYVYVGRPDLAIPHFEAALALGPDNPGLLQNLGFALRRVGRVEEAIAHYRRALEIAPASAETRYDLARALAAAGAAEEALAHLRRVIEQRPESPEPLVEAARLLVARSGTSAGGSAEAVRLAERAAELTGRRDARVLRVLAAAWAARGDATRAGAIEDEARSLEKRLAPRP